MNFTFLKRRYYDMRIGGGTINPLIQTGNFSMLAYLTLNEIIPIYIFIPVFVMGMFTVFTITGLKFRQVQLSTDEDLKYEKKSENAKTIYQMMLAQKQMMENMNIPPTKEFLDRMEYMKSISLA